MRNRFLNTGQRGYNPIRKFKTVLRGMRYAIASDFPVAYKLALSLPLMAACLYWRDWVDAMAVLLATGLMVMAEVFNTAIEALCDLVEPNYNEKIGLIKDVSAAAVGIGIGLWCLVMGYEGHKLFQLLQT
jgi:diacylglycerol kinase